MRLYSHEIVHFEEWKHPIGYYTLNEPKKLIVFVHGLGGHATSTWDEFTNIIRNYSVFSNADVIFYGYDSTAIQATTNGSLLSSFLDTYAIPSNAVNGVDRKVPAQYEKIIFLAHSLGAFVVRKALIYSSKKIGITWIEKTKMFLLAPAHNGSDVPERVMEVLPGYLKIGAHVARHFLPVIQDLQKSSPTIKTLKRETKNLQKSGKGRFTIAEIVAWAQYERVVINDDFCNDPVPVTVLDKNHMNICKPELISYEKPLDLLKKIL